MTSLSKLLRAAAALLLAGAAAIPAVSAPVQGDAKTEQGAAPITVMVVGMMHFDNPALEYRNAVVDDVLAPARQRESEALVNALAAFRPTVIGTEWRPDAVRRDYPRFRAGTLPPSRDETVQIAFRLGHKVGTDRCWAWTPRPSGRSRRCSPTRAITGSSA